MNSGQACRPCRGSCSPFPGRGCFGDLPGTKSSYPRPPQSLNPSPASAICGQDGKNHKQKADKTQEENKHNSTRGKYFSLFRTVMVHCDRPRSNCLLSWVETVSRCCRPIGDLANSSRAPACTFEVVHSSLSSTPTSDLNRIHSCSVPVKFKNHPCWFQERKSFLLR